MLTATLGFVLLLRPTPQPTERIVTVYVQPPIPSTGETPVPPQKRTGETPVPSLRPSISTDTEPPVDDSDYLRLRREVLAKGVDALPPPAPWPAATPADDAGILLDMPHDSREPWFLRLKRSLKSGDAL